MNLPRGVAAAGKPDAGTEDSPATRDLVGWALQSPLRSDSALPLPVARRVLATALGVREEVLESWDVDALETALARLRGLVSYYDHLSSAAMTDDLTGALRRGAGMAALGRELDRARRTGQRDLMVGFFDVDGLKAVNDASGHAAGDEILRAVVRAIRERIRSYDLVLRYGGDEFVCVLLGVTGEQAERTFDDIARRVKAYSGHSVSLGLAEMLEDDTAEAVVARADAALYQGRAAGPG